MMLRLTKAVNTFGETMNIREINLGEVFTISVINNPSTGYLWKHKPVDGFVLTDQKHHLENEYTLGGRTETTFYFRAEKKGEWVLRLEKTRPWEKNNLVEVVEQVIVIS